MAKGKVGKKEKRKKEEERKQREQAESHKDDDAKRKKDASDIAEQELRRQEVARGQALQRGATNEYIQSLSDAISAIRCERWEAMAWSRYTSCCGKPQLEEPQQLNAYLSQWLEDNSVSADAIMGRCSDALKLLDELDELFYEARHVTENILLSCAEIQRDFHSAIQLKIDMATLGVLQETSFSTNPETGNSYYHIENETIRLSIWSNLACNPRYNGYNLTEMGVSFTLPRTVVTLECAIRILKTDFDHFSSLNHTFSALKVPVFPAAGARIMRAAKKCGDWLEGFVDLSDYMILGHLLHVDLVTIPHQPCKVNRWVMTRVEEPRLLRYIPWTTEYAPYAAPKPIEPDDKRDDDTIEELAAKAALREKEELKKLVRVTWRVPEKILWFDPPKLVRWNREHQVWSTSGIHETSYKEEQATFTFNTVLFGIFGLLQPRFSAFPYGNWELKPRAPGKASFSLTTAVGVVELLVKGTDCILVSAMSNERVFLEHLVGKPFKPAFLIKKIVSAGIMIAPKTQDYRRCQQIKSKSEYVEDLLYKQMAFTLQASGYCFSRWNATIGPDKFALRVQDRNEQGAPQATQPVILVTDLRATLLAVTDVNQTFCEAASDKDPAVADLYHLIESIGQKGTREILDQPDLDFIDAVYQLLSTVRVLCC